MASSNAAKIDETREHKTGANETTAERIAEAVHTKVDEAAKVGATAEARMREATSGAVNSASEAKEKTVEKSQDVLKQTEKNIRENPLTAAGVAFAAGFVISALLRR